MNPIAKLLLELVPFLIDVIYEAVQSGKSKEEAKRCAIGAACQRHPELKGELLPDLPDLEKTEDAHDRAKKRIEGD